MAALNIAFEAPDNSRVGRPSTARPIDLVYLAAQTAGNKVLEAEVLQVFARQARIALQELSRNDAEGRKAAAHRLKGSAEAVGAFTVAKIAAELEGKGDDAAANARLAAAVLEAENFILKLSR